MTLVGEANDYVGKGMNGGDIAIMPPPGSSFRWVGGGWVEGCASMPYLTHNPFPCASYPLLLHIAACETLGRPLYNLITPAQSPLGDHALTFPPDLQC